MFAKSFESYIQIDLSDNEHWSNIATRILQQSEEKSIIPPRSILFNGEKVNVFSVDELIPEKGTEELTNGEKNRNVLMSLCRLLKHIDASEFLKRQFVMLGDGMVFYNPSQNEPRFIVAPVECDNADEELSLVDKWDRSCLAFILRHIDEKDCALDSNLLQVKNLCLANRIDRLDEIIELLDNRQPFVPVKRENKSLSLSYQGQYGHFALYDNEGTYKIGSKASCQGVISFNPTVSREHCEIYYDGNDYYVEDLGSSNGTYLNGTRVMRGMQMMIKDGDVVRISDMDFKIEIR